MRTSRRDFTPNACSGIISALLTLVFATAATPARSAELGHCAPARVTPVPGDPGAWRIETARGVTVARRSPDPPQRSAATVFAEVRVFPASFDMDGDTLSPVRDTILVTPQTVVRFVRRGPGFHTITSGADSGDPNASSEYNEIFDDSRQLYEHTYTTLGVHNFFCYIHEPVMVGTIIVTNALADADGPGIVRQAGFTRAPAPNPARDAVSFAVALPRAGSVRLTVHDVAGRVVATIHDGPLPAGEHPFRWDARSREGRRVESGRYFVRFAGGGVERTRAVSLVR